MSVEEYQWKKYNEDTEEWEQFTPSQEEFRTHKSNSMPHQFLDGATPYRYGFKQEDGHLVFMYEEVV